MIIIRLLIALIAALYSFAVGGAAWDCTIDWNCPDFDSWPATASFFISCPGDPAGLDRDKDFIPCEKQLKDWIDW